MAPYFSIEFMYFVSRILIEIGNSRSSGPIEITKLVLLPSSCDQKCCFIKYVLLGILSPDMLQANPE